MASATHSIKTEYPFIGGNRYDRNGKAGKFHRCPRGRY